MNLKLSTFSGFLNLILSCHGQTTLTADGNSKNTYDLIDKVLGGGKTAYEVPDCTHKFQHIQQKTDSELNEPVFVFYIHLNKDGNGCEIKDRQRNEIKTFNPSPDELKGFEGDTVSFSWNFKLDSGFKPSTKFTHIHQIKAGDGDNADSPIMTLTPRKGKSSNILEIIHVDNSGTKNVLKSTDLKPFLGKWIHVQEEITYGSEGSYSVTLSTLNGNKKLLSYSGEDLDLWRDGTTFVRPKWGIYRGLDDKEDLRDEAVLFNKFCLGKGDDKCE